MRVEVALLVSASIEIYGSLLATTTNNDTVNQISNMSTPALILLIFVFVAYFNAGQNALFASIKSSSISFATFALGTVFDNVMACHSFW
jgi:hypothetical protein